LGYKTLAEHWDGTRWSVVPTANTAMRNNTLRAVSVLAPDDVWAVGQQDDGSGNAMTLVEHWDGYRWRVDPSATVPGSLGAVIAFSSTDVWVSGFVLEHWDGTRWTVTDIGAANYLGSLVGSSRDLWAAGYRTIQPFGPVLTLSYHWDGAAWTAHRAVDPLTDSTDDEDVLVGMTVAPGDTHPWAVGTLQILMAAHRRIHWSNSGMERNGIGCERRILAGRVWIMNSSQSRRAPLLMFGWWEQLAVMAARTIRLSFCDGMEQVGLSRRIQGPEFWWGSA